MRLATPPWYTHVHASTIILGTPTAESSVSAKVRSRRSISSGIRRGAGTPHSRITSLGQGAQPPKLKLRYPSRCRHFLPSRRVIHTSVPRRRLLVTIGISIARFPLQWFPVLSSRGPWHFSVRPFGSFSQTGHAVSSTFLCVVDSPCVVFRVPVRPARVQPAHVLPGALLGSSVGRLSPESRGTQRKPTTNRSDNLTSHLVS
jgi:hypothetical protein